jgi:uncharacterized membrane-anchored protein
MSNVLAAQNVFGPSTLVLTSLLLSMGLLGVRAFVHESKIQVTKSALVWLDVAVVSLAVLFFLFVYLRFRNLA